MRSSLAAGLSAAIMLWGAGLALADEGSGGIAGPGGVPIHGRIFTDVYAPTQDITQKELNFVGTSAWLQVEPKVDEDTSAHIILETSLTEAGVSGAPTNTFNATVTLREAYASYSRGPWDLRFGRQIIPWGVSDGINPTDFLGAKDYTRFNPDDEIKRVGATDFKVSFTPNDGASPVTFTGVWQPVFPRSKFLISPNSVPDDVIFLPEQLPTRNLAHSELALRTTYFTPGWDFSLTGFYGWNHLPEYVFSQINSSAQVELLPTYHQIRAVGGDFAKTFDDWILRLEAAYTWTDNDSGANPIVEPSFLNSVVGVEKTLGENWRVNVQGLLKYHPNYTDPSEATGDTPLHAEINSSVAAFNALLQGYQVKTRTGASIRLAYTNEKAGWELETAAVAYYQTDDFLIKPKATRSFTDTFKVSVGGDFYGGPEDKQLGALHYYNSLFFEAKYTF